MRAYKKLMALLFGEFNSKKLIVWHLNYTDVLYYFGVPDLKNLRKTSPIDDLFSYPEF